jgi:hypothetical protein
VTTVGLVFAVILSAIALTIVVGVVLGAFGGDE